MDILYQDNQIIVCLKPAGVLSTDEPGGLPELLRAQLGDPTANLRTVHRLDRAVGGVMVLARTKHAASDLGRQVMNRQLEKEYLTVLHGVPEEPAGRLTDLLRYDRAERRSRVVTEPEPDAREAVLDYALLGTAEGMSLIRVTLHTGRTHQIRCQFSARELPLAGDRKYGLPSDDCPIALWSARIALNHPKTGVRMEFRHCPPACFPWTLFQMKE